MKLVKDMYAGKPIPENTKDEKVALASEFFRRRLNEELDKQYLWLARAFVAVEAGRWQGDKLKRRRVKLLSLLNKTRVFLGLELVVFESGWEMRGLFYDFDAIRRWEKSKDFTPEEGALAQAYDHFIKTAFSVESLHEHLNKTNQPES